MPLIITLTGSPSANPRSAPLLEYVQQELTKQGYDNCHLAVRDLDSGELLRAEVGGSSIQSSIVQLEQAVGIIITTHVYEVAYTGILKAFLDLLPPKLLNNKAILPITTGGTFAHLLAGGYALTPNLASLGAVDILPVIHLRDSDVEYHHQQGLWIRNSETKNRLDSAISHLCHIVNRINHFS